MEPNKTMTTRDKNKKGKNAKLTQAQREEIIRLCLEGNTTQAAIAKQFGCSKPNVTYIMQKYRRDNDLEAKKKKARKEKTMNNPATYPTDPIRFRIGKILEIESDIQFARDEKVIHTLGSLHKLHLSLHDELRTFVDASKETHGATPEQLRMEIVDAIQSLPPILKKQVMDELLVDGSNVVRLNTQ
jgi:transposase-like protein